VVSSSTQGWGSL